MKKNKKQSSIHSEKEDNKSFEEKQEENHKKEIE